MFIRVLQNVRVVRDDYDDDDGDDVSALVGGSLPPLQRYNSTPDLLDDSRGPSKVAQEVTSPNANDFRSLRDVIVTTKVGAGDESPPTNFLLTARNMLGGSTGNLLDAQRRLPGSSNARPPPPPPVRLLSTFSSDQQRTSRSDQDRDAEVTRSKKHGSTGNLLESSSYQSGLDFQSSGHVRPPPKPARQQNRQSRVSNSSGNVVEPPSRMIQSKRFGSTDNLLDSRDGYGQSVAVGPSNTDRGRKYGPTGMKRYGSEDNLLSDTSSWLTVPAQMNAQHQQRLQSDDLPPPPSPATFAGLEYSSQEPNDDYADLLQV